MKSNKALYLLSGIPLLIGSATFFLWFILRLNFALDFQVQLPAALSIIIYLLSSLILIGLLVYQLIQKFDNWKRFLIPILISTITFPIIIFYSELVDLYSQKVFVRIIDDSDKMDIEHVWTVNFKKYLHSNDEVIIYTPVFVYELYEDGHPVIDDSYPVYQINPINIDIGDTLGRHFQSFELGAFEPGTCETIFISELLE